MGMLSSENLASRWSLSTRRVNILCKSGRIPGAVKIGGRWFAPDSVSKPRDARRKSVGQESDIPESAGSLPIAMERQGNTVGSFLPKPEQMSNDLLVRDLFTFGFFKDWKVVGGKAGIFNRITSLNMMESPDIANWIQKGQLVISTGYCIRDDVNVQRQIIRDLSAAGCAGLAIKMMRFFRTIPRHMIDVADECGLPLIEIPDSYNISEVMNSITKKIYARRLEELELSYDLFTNFTEAAFQGDIDEIPRRLGMILNAGVTVSDSNWSRMSSYVPPDHIITEETVFKYDQPVPMNSLENASNPYQHIFFWDNREFYRYIFMIGEKDKPRGFLSVWTKWKDLTNNEKLAVENAAAVMYLRLTGKVAEEENLYSQRDIFLIDEYFDRVQSETIAMRRAVSCGLNPTVYYRAVIMRSFLDKRTPQDFSRASLVVAREIVRKRHGIHMFQIDSSIVWICPQDDPDSSKEVETAIREFRGNMHQKDGWISFFVGDPFKIIQINRSFAQAKEISQLYDVKVKKKHGETLYFQDYRIPAALITMDKKKQALLHGEIIQTLEQYDRDHNSELLRTLDCYFRSGMNVSKTAKELFIHRNTLLFRLDKIRDLIHMDLSEPDDLLTVQMALRLKDYNQK